MKKLRVFDMPWNLHDQYDLLTFQFIEWSWLIQYRVSHKDLDPESAKSLRWVPYYDYGYYDAAILHLDLHPVEPSGRAKAKRQVYEELNTLITDVPKIVIVHGTCKVDQKQVEELRRFIGNNHCIVGSREVANTLGLGTVIAPGISLDRWPDRLKEPRVVTSVTRTTEQDIINLETLSSLLAARDIILCRIGLDYIPQDWLEYVNFLSRSLIYVAPSVCSWRKQLEARACGCCVLVLGPSTCSHQSDHEVNESDAGYLHENLIDSIEDLLSNPGDAFQMGQDARATLSREHNWDRYSQAWEQFLNTVIK